MSDIFTYVIKRLLMGILVVLSVTVLLFGIMQLMPGDPIQLISDPRVPPEKIAQLRAQWGLDKPLYMQYFMWLKNISHGNFGTSITTKQPVAELIRQRLPYTLLLSGTALVFEYLLAVPLGLFAASKKGSLADSSLIVITIILWSMPGFWLGILLILIFSIWMQILPISGFSGISSLILPAVTLILPMLAQIFRLTRSEVTDAIDEKYVATAYAKGLSGRKVLIRHVLRNAMIPVTVMFFLSLPWLIGGSVIVEKVFAWPGMGSLLWKGISTQDYPIVQGIVFVIAILTVVCNIIGDILSGFLDPRIRLG